MPAPQDFGARLAAERGRRRWSQRMLGARLGLANGNFIGMVERGERLPSVDLTRAIARELGLPERELLQLRYEADPRSALPLLLAPPVAALPRLRRLLLSTCDRPERLDAELRPAAHSLLERILWATVRDHVLLPSLARERHPPRRLTALLERARRGPADGPPDDAAFEEEGDIVASYVHGVLESWDYDDARLTISLQLRSDPAAPLTLPLAPPQQASPRAQPLLDAALAGAGLAARDVEELLALVAFKRARQAER